MSLTTLMKDRLDIKAANVGQSDIHSPTRTETVRSRNVKCRISRISAQERATQGRQEEVSSHKILFPAGTKVLSTDRLWNGTVYYEVNTIDPMNYVSRQVTVKVEATQFMSEGANATS